MAKKVFTAAGLAKQLRNVIINSSLEIDSESSSSSGRATSILLNPASYSGMKGDLPVSTQAYVMGTIQESSKLPKTLDTPTKINDVTQRKGIN